MDRVIDLMYCNPAGEVLITGGLGALGILTALWAALSSSSSGGSSSGGGGNGSAAASGSTSHIQLLSRSGRPSQDALQQGSPLHALLSGAAGGRSGVGASVTMRRCDAASAEEAAAALQSRSCAASTLLHAAGVLQVMHRAHYRAIAPALSYISVCMEFE
jgi:hypothetical protein